MTSRPELVLRRGESVRAFATLVRVLGAVARRWRDRRSRAWRAGLYSRELRELDDHMLHDLGIDRSEIGSVASEMAGLEGPTRVRATFSPDFMP